MAMVGEVVDGRGDVGADGTAAESAALGAAPLGRDVPDGAFDPQAITTNARAMGMRQRRVRTFMVVIRAVRVCG